MRKVRRGSLMADAKPVEVWLTEAEREQLKRFAHLMKCSQGEVIALALKALREAHRA